MTEERQLSIDTVEGAEMEIESVSVVYPIDALEWKPDPSKPYQMFPPLTADQYESLKESIRQYGVTDAVEVDDEGNILNGHNRFDICRELGIPCPIRVVNHLKTPQEKRDYARSMNCAHREITTAMRKQQAAEMLREDSTRSDRAIGRIVGLAQPTVGLIRRDMGLAEKSFQSQHNEEEPEQEGPDLSFLEGEDWQPWHRMEAYSYLGKMAEEDKLLICEIVSHRRRHPSEALKMLATAAAFGERDWKRLAELWRAVESASSRRALAVSTLLGTTPGPDPRLVALSDAAQTIGRVAQLDATRTGREAEPIGRTIVLLKTAIALIRDGQEVW